MPPGLHSLTQHVRLTPVCYSARTDQSKARLIITVLKWTEDDADDVLWSGKP